VECHEKWEYDARQQSQRLVCLVALCPACHAVKHFGRTQAEGREQEAMGHLMKVNRWTRSKASWHIKQALETWKARSKVVWKLDITWLRTSGRLKEVK